MPSVTPQPPKTTFIPKKTLTKRDKSKSLRYSGWVTVFSVFLLVFSVAGYSALLLYKVYLEQRSEDLAVSLERAKGAFDPTIIEELKRVDMRLSSADQVLSKHVTITPLFVLFENETLQRIRYTQMSFIAKDDGAYQITMDGEADDYATIALQSDIFSDSRNVRDHIFSNLNLNSKGNISFKFSAFVEPGFLRYIAQLANNTQ
ncbi:MAG: hypothetical protein COW88_00170 [Candidatus Lloydbacteria bacterium CG22_combo_CG10-13_8_21_14_all_47_15]|uniref:Uncharacterized protein n=1 Tax=Candidatus Lloydbacteria bacterium CG22_combo_CG10-13_8_21_14_all_47_15 TaxID=1974635 RepID=A0A2H0CVQ1_9BACT|nr:MAG: hypothetical protein COW88_00170 [Candidatus Lloydbacteria bacterium CG22_combo_CG10-13_8_21_14_all_47_15]